MTAPTTRRIDTDEEWVRDINRRVRRLENPGSVRVGPWVLQNNPLTGSLIASRPGQSVDLGTSEPVEIDIWALAQRAKGAADTPPVQGGDGGGELPDLTEIAESIFSALYEQLTGIGIDPIGALQKLGDFLKIELGGPVDITRLPLLPLSHIRDVVTELLDDPFFDNPATLLNFADWLWDDSDGVQTPGVAKTTADGLTHTIFSNPIPVRPGDTLNLMSKVKSEGLVSTGSPLQMLVSFYTAANAMIGAPVLLASRGSTGGAWATMTATDVDVPEGATYAVQELTVTPSATAGSVKYGQASVSKVGLLPTSYINGLVDALEGLWAGLAARLQDFQDLLDVFFDAPIGSGLGQLTDVANRIKFLSPLTGFFDASKLGNMAQLPSIPDGLNKVGDLGALVDKATAALSGLTQVGQTVVGAALEDAESTMTNLFDMLITNTRKIQDLEAEATSASVGGRRFAYNFADYPDGPFPPGLFNLTYSGPGTSTLRISGGSVQWQMVNNGWRQVVATSLTPTLTDFQSVRGTMSSPPEQGANTFIGAMGRANSAGTDFVFARGYCTGFLQYKGDIGCVKGGIEYTWATGVSLTWSLDIRVVMGVGTNARRHMVLSGSTVVWDGTETPGKESNISENHRYWGCYARTNGSNSPGGLAGASIVDNAPPAVVGTSFKASKRTGGDMTLPAGNNPVPNNFYETIDHISPDLIYRRANNCEVEATKQGTYIVAWRAFHGVYATNTGGHGVLFKNGVPYEKWAWGDTPFVAGWGIMTSRINATTGFAIVPLNPGDKITVGFYMTNNMSNTGDDVLLADGAESWVSVTRVGI
ncbi:minor tail protein [Mycobacterium phage Thonko]|uniref:Minor tail protein n=1 Tax=Mycobacterium phage Thonko TaxID=2282910 RepID=A0A346FC76_9CAUD|nr:minor tail protein [Mycobacterium phage Thonko]AXN53301.1 minor tail protein [Mycobacterium phage Thonko]